MNNLIKVAILTGGESAELAISLASAKVVAQHIIKEKYTVSTVNISTFPWQVYENETLIGTIDLNDFSYINQDQKHFFDVVFMAIHGTPAEDGKLQGYFDFMKIPYTCSGNLASAITFDKDICKKLLKDFPLKQANSFLLTNKDNVNEQLTDAFHFPLFVKPNKNGSSYGTSKVNQKSDLDTAIQNAFKYDDEVLVEEYIQGRELACGVIAYNNEIIALPITEIISENEFFDYEAKYLGKSKEITPAQIPDHISKEAQAKAKSIFKILKLKGAVRVDYFLKDDDLYLLEINTIPGLSAESILPQEAKAHGFSLEEFFDIMLTEALKTN